MNKYFFAGGITFFFCLLFPFSIHAASIHWQDVINQVEPTLSDTVTFPTAGTGTRTGLIDLQSRDIESTFDGNSYQWSRRKVRGTETTTLALPESGTLLLLGIGLAGIASLIRKSQTSNDRFITRHHNESPSGECGNSQGSEQSL